MLSAHLAARELERRRAEQSAEFARQLPLHAENPADLHPPADADDDNGYRCPDWTTNY